MEVHCYVCHTKTKKWTQNLVEVKSKHSRTPIAKILSKFLDDYPTDRNLYHRANCICNDCLSKIYSYDWTCIKAKEQETELRNLLLKTESLIKAQQFVGDLDNDGANELPGPMNPLNDVVHIIDDEDYNHVGQMDDKANLKAEMANSFTSKSTAAAAKTSSQPEIRMTSVRKKFPIEEIKPKPTAVCDIKPTIEKPMTTTLSQPQQQPTTVTPKIEPIKKGKPIIVRVVKRVPFLKSNPSIASSQPNSAATPAVTGPSNTNETVAAEETPKTNAKMSPVKKTASGKQTPICKYCDGRFPNAKILQVRTNCLNSKQELSNILDSISFIFRIISNCIQSTPAALRVIFAFSI